MGQLLLVLLGALVVTAVARSRDLTAPLLLVLTGLVVSLIPGISEIQLPPEVLLTVVLPPLLYAAALDSSFLNFRARIRPIVHHGVLQVIVTSFVIGWAAYLLIPSLPLTSAIVLGAVIAPPDAVTAAAIGRQLKLPRGIMTILGGESLINDAAALTVYRMALAAVIGTTPSLGEGMLVFTRATVVGVVIGLAVGFVAHAARTRVPDVDVSTVMGVLVPFVAYLGAEELGGSGVLAVVAAGLYVGHHQPRARAAGRLQEHTVWSAINLLLESLVFALIGLQLKHILTTIHAAGRDLWTLVLAAVLVLLAAIALRIVWMFASNFLPGVSHLLRPRRRPGQLRPAAVAPWRRSMVVAWTGMRGVVTLAAAGAIPYALPNGDPFPAREVIQLVAFVVTVGTLLIQGTTLPWLIRKLDVTDPAEAERDDRTEVEARRVATSAALSYLDELTPERLGCDGERRDRIVSRLRDLVQHQGEAAAEQVGRTPAERADTTSRTFADVRREVLKVERKAIVAERDAGHLDDEILRRMLRELDTQEAAINSSWRYR